MLVGKLAMKGPVNAAVAESVWQMAAEDAHARVRVSAQCGADGIARGDAKRAAEPTLIVPHGGFTERLYELRQERRGRRRGRE